MNTENLKSVMEIIENDEQWDNRELGADEHFVRVVETDLDQQKAIDEAVGLQMISIRLPKALIDDFKFLGDVHNLKYQTLMRQVLARFADSEKKRLATKAVAAQFKATREEVEAKDQLGKRQRHSKRAARV